MEAAKASHCCVVEMSMLQDERESWRLSLEDAERQGEFEMEHQDFYEGLFLTMERSGQDFRTDHEKLEQDLLDSHLTIDLWNSYTNKLGQVSLTVSCYDEQSQHEFYF